MGARKKVAVLALSGLGLASSTRARAAEQERQRDVVLAEAPRAAPPPARFGERGEVAVSGSSSASLEQTSWAGGTASPRQMTGIFVTGSVAYFIARDLSLGVRLAYQHDAVSGYPSWDYASIGPTVGYNIPLGERWSIWPDVRAAWGEGWGSGISSAQTLALGADVPVLFHPVPHLFVGIGPTAGTALPIRGPDTGSPTQYGLTATLGGWLGS
jgi:hypothetical protein